MSQRWKVILAFAGVFAAGVVCGEPLSAWYSRYEARHRPPFAERTMKRYERELHLTPAQREKVGPVLVRWQDEWRRLRQENVRAMTTLIDRMHAEVGAELTAEQREKLELMRQELRARAERLRGRLPGGSGAAPRPI